MFHGQELKKIELNASPPLMKFGARLSVSAIEFVVITRTTKILITLENVEVPFCTSLSPYHSIKP
jgi:hypothetical protein